MMKLVRPLIKVSIAFWINTSVRVSTELVASSRISILGSAKMARAIVRSCFWPCEMLVRLLVEHRAVALRQRAHEVIDLGRPRSPVDLFVAGPRRGHSGCSP